jgi:hypothetical protein
MGEKITFEGTEYDIDRLSDEAKATLNSIQFVVSRISELSNTQALLQRAKNSYLESLKKEILSQKAGFFLDDD